MQDAGGGAATATAAAVCRWVRGLMLGAHTQRRGQQWRVGAATATAAADVVVVEVVEGVA